MPEPQSYAGEPIPPDCELIKIHVDELKHLFHSIDPSPLPERDLDPKAEEFIVVWAREARRDAGLALTVHLDRPSGLPEEASFLGKAVRGFFERRAAGTRRNLRQLFRRGRMSLLIGVIFLTLSIGAGQLVESVMAGRHLGQIFRESLLIGGWVAMWRPLEIFLYDWWPIRAEARLFDRLAVMPIRLGYSGPAHI